MSLDKCKRCGRLFNRVQTPICVACMPKEEADYDRIRGVLNETPGLSVEQVASAAEVEKSCVLRMIDAGRLANSAVSDSVPCGRCGAPAISVTKRLCEKCLTELDRECAENMRGLREKMRGGEAVPTVHEVVEAKRQVSTTDIEPGRARQRMAIQAKLNLARNVRKSKHQASPKR